MSDEFYWIAVAVVSVLSTARLTRLVVMDKFPPVVRLKKTFLILTDTSRLAGYQLLVFCGYCLSFWMMALVLFFGWVCGVYGTDPFGGSSDIDFWAWWLFNGTLGGSYLATMIAVRDGDPAWMADSDEDTD